MLDCGWVGGLSEAKKIANMAEAYHLPIAPHDCTGPINYVADVHLDFAVTNVYVQETVRAYIHGWYADLVTWLPAHRERLRLPAGGPRVSGWPSSTRSSPVRTSPSSAPSSDACSSARYGWRLLVGSGSGSLAPGSRGGVLGEAVAGAIRGDAEGADAHTLTAGTWLAGALGLALGVTLLAPWLGLPALLALLRWRCARARSPTPSPCACRRSPAGGRK